MNGAITRIGALAFLVAVTACESKLTGNEGNLTFSYTADDNFLDFNKPIGVGARLDYEVEEVGSNRPVTLTSVSVSDGFAVIDFSGNDFTLEATAAGNALVEVEATTRDGEATFDSVNINAAVPDVLRLGHTCTSENAARYLNGQRIVVPFELERSNGQPVIGYGLYPVTFSDPSSLSLDTSIRAQQFLHLDTGLVGNVTISSTIDATTLSLQIISRAEIDGAEIVLGNLQETDVGDRNAYYILPLAGGNRICQADVQKSVASTTPSICTVADRAAPTGDREFGWIEVTGLSAGLCEFTVTYPEGNGGGGATVPLQISIAP